jgi:hypothetical protein
LPDDSGDFQTIFPGILHPAIGYIERVPPLHSKNRSCIIGFTLAVFGCSSRAHLTLGQVENAGALSFLRRAKNRSTARLFYVIAMSRDRQNI